MRAVTYTVIVLCLPFTLADSAAQEIFDSVPENERTYFLAYQVSKAITRSKEHTEEQWDIPLDLQTKFQVLDVPEDFPENFCRWLAGNTNTTYEQLMDQMTECLILHTESNCAVLDYPGGNCCPF